jgi:hypothetical protein
VRDLLVLPPEETIRNRHDSDPEGFRDSLIKTWRVAPERERDRLQHALFAMEVDPRQVAAEPVAVSEKES